MSETFSGVEIEQAIIAGMFRAFDADREVVIEDVVVAINETFPLARSRSREIAEITNWAATNAKLAS